MFVYTRLMESLLETITAEGAATDALAQLRDGADLLIEVAEVGGLDHYSNEQLVVFMQEFERVRRRLSLVDHQVVREAQARKLPDTLTQPSVQRVLTAVLRVSKSEANRRVQSAEATGPRRSLLGQPLAPLRPVLATAQRAGEISPEHVQIVQRALATVDRPGFDPRDVAGAEGLLTNFAATFGPEDLRRLADSVVDRIDPDGSLPREELNHDRRHIELRPRSDGSWAGELRLTGPLGAKLHAVLGPLAKPRVNNIVGPTGKLVEAPDERSYGQRMHDALEDVCDRLLRAGGVPESGGTPATVIVTMTLDDLVARTGYGTTSDGTLISTRQVLAMAAEAEIIPTVLNSTGAVLDLGRTHRIASRSQTLALIARDVGCSFPGCSHPPEWCERHHIREWVDGGLTNLGNLTLLCRYHHHHFATRGWECRINIDGIPEWTPPKHVDRHEGR
jgi:hypothetical protein